MILQDDRKVSLTFSALDARGNPARIDGMPVWGSSDESLLLVEASDDGMSAVVTPTGPVGIGQVSVRVDADLGAGVREVIGLLDVEVVGGEAVSIVIVPGEPEPI